MAIKTEEISALIKEQVESYRQQLVVEEAGIVTHIGDGIAYAHSLESAMGGELAEFSDGLYGMAQNLEVNGVGTITLGGFEAIREGDKIQRAGKIVEVPVGEALIGRIADPLDQPLDGLGEIKTDKIRPVEATASGVMQRQSIAEPMQTDLKAIDALILIGRGQRELVIGDRRTGEIPAAIDTITN